MESVNEVNLLKRTYVIFTLLIAGATFALNIILVTQDTKNNNHGENHAVFCGIILGLSCVQFLMDFALLILFFRLLY